MKTEVNYEGRIWKDLQEVVNDMRVWYKLVTGLSLDEKEGGKEKEVNLMPNLIRIKG